MLSPQSSYYEFNVSGNVVGLLPKKYRHDHFIHEMPLYFKDAWWIKSNGSLSTVEDPIFHRNDILNFEVEGCDFMPIDGEGKCWEVHLQILVESHESSN